MAYYNNTMAGSSIPVSGNITLSTGPSVNYTNQVYTVSLAGSGSGGTGGVWATAPSSPYVYTSAGSNGSSSSLQVSGDADIKGDLKVQGISIVDMLTKINERLAILVPDPKLLEKYEALKLAYEHYKTLEALCVEQDNPPPAT